MGKGGRGVEKKDRQIYGKRPIKGRMDDNTVPYRMRRSANMGWIRKLLLFVGAEKRKQSVDETTRGRHGNPMDRPGVARFFERRFLHDWIERPRALLRGFM